MREITLIDEAVLTAIDLIYTPYIWGGDSKEGLDCSGFVGYLLRQVGLVPETYDDTAQGYYNKYRFQTTQEPYRGCLVFYGKSPQKIVHIMFALNNMACIGAVRGNKWIDTITAAKERKARVDFREIDYRNDRVACVDPFLKQ